MILKFRLPGALVHPFVGAGYSPRIIHGTDALSGYYLSGITQNPPANVYTYTSTHYNTTYPVTHGVVVSGGVTLRLGHLSVSPEARYVHWKTPFLSEYGGDGSYRFVSNQDELFVLVGVSWH